MYDSLIGLKALRSEDDIFEQQIHVLNLSPGPLGQLNIKTDLSSNNEYKYKTPSSSYGLMNSPMDIFLNYVIFDENVSIKQLII